MNKQFIIFITGAVLGAVVGIYSYKAVGEKAHEERLQQELEEIRDLKERAAMKLNENKPEEEAAVTIKEVDADYYDEEDEELRDQYEEYDDINKRYSDVTYNTCFDNEDSICSEPYIIEVDEFFNGKVNYDKVTLTYYDRDGSLVDESEELVHNVVDTIGEEALFEFGNKSDDPNVVYIRNEKLAIDYEIIRVFNSYAEDVLGIEMGDKSKRDRIYGGEDEC